MELLAMHQPNQQTLAELQSLAVPNAVRFESGNGGLLRAVLTSASGDPELSLQGAHVTHFQPRGQQPVLFVSAQSQFRADKPIRGGIPICFPWFAAKADDPNAPMHGFARTMLWTVESAKRVDDDRASVTLSLRSNERTRALWPHDFGARYTVSIGATLDIALEVTNESPGPFKFEEALHSYFAVGDVRRARVGGLEGAEFLDKVTGNTRRRQPDSPIEFTGETDRVYLHTPATAVVDDPALGRRIRVAKSGSHTTVVWNPWTAKAKSM